MPLATIAEVQARLGRVLTAGETTQANAWLADASAMFVQRAIQKFEVGNSVVRLFPRDGIVRLVQRPVIEINEVTDRANLPFQFQQIPDRGTVRVAARQGCEIIE